MTHPVQMLSVLSQKFIIFEIKAEKEPNLEYFCMCLSVAGVVAPKRLNQFWYFFVFLKDDLIKSVVNEREHFPRQFFCLKWRKILQFFVFFCFRTRGVLGQLLVNDEVREEKTFRKQSCYIMQNDNLQPLLTVHEAMTVAANLKLSSKFTHKEKQSKVTPHLRSNKNNNNNNCFVDRSKKF